MAVTVVGGSGYQDYSQSGLQGSLGTGDTSSVATAVGYIEPPVSVDSYTPANPASVVTGIYTNQATVLSFQSPAITSGDWQYGGTVGGATYSGSSGVAADNSAFTASNPATGGDVGFVQGTGRISIAVGGFQAGVSYTFSFNAAQRSGDHQNVQILLDGVSIGTVNTDSSGDYQTITTQAVSPGAGTHTLTFVGVDSAGGDNTLLLGDVTRNAVAPVFADGNFTSAAQGSGHYAYDPTSTPTTFSGSAGVSGNNSAFTNGSTSLENGAEAAFVQGPSSFSQAVAGFEAGQSYRIEFAAAQRSGQNQNLAVSVDGVSVGSFTPNAAGYEQYTSASFSVGAGTHTISFAGLDTAGGDNTAFVTGISIVPVDATIANGQTTDSSIGSGQESYESGSVAGFTFTGTAGIAGTNSAFTTGAQSAGGDVFALQEATGTISQSVSGFQDNEQYTLSFSSEQRANDRQNFAVLVDGQQIETFTPTVGYEPYSLQLPKLAAGSHTITFQGIDSVGGDNTALITDIGLAGKPSKPSPVPTSTQIAALSPLQLDGLSQTQLNASLVAGLRKRFASGASVTQITVGIPERRHAVVRRLVAVQHKHKFSTYVYSTDLEQWRRNDLANRTRWSVV